MFEGKAVTLQALLKAAGHSQGQQPDVYGAKGFFNPVQVVPVQLRGDHIKHGPPGWSDTSERVHTYSVASLED